MTHYKSLKSMEIKLQSIQFAFFFKQRNFKVNSIFDDELRVIFNGSQNIQTLPDDPLLDEVPSLTVSSDTSDKTIQGNRLRLDYYLRRVIDTDAESIEALLNDLKVDISLLRRRIPVEIGVKRIGLVLNFSFSSVSESATAVLLAEKLPRSISGDFDNAGIRLVKKIRVLDMDVNNVLSLRSDDNDRTMVLCQRDFNSYQKEDYSQLLTNEKISSFVDAMKEELKLAEIQTLLQDA